jgi:ACR3 family arsenite efflux pump ArsB
MLFFVFASVQLKEISKSFTHIKFSVSSLLLNFLWTPVFAFVLSEIFLKEADLQTGFLMLMVTPCTDWYLIFTRLAHGNVTLGASILPLNLFLQIALLPLYLFLFMGKSISFGAAAILQSFILVLLVPLLLAGAVKGALGKIGARALWRRILTKVLENSDGLQFLFLCLAILSMFASQGPLLLANLIVFLRLLAPLLLFFAVNFALALCVGKKLGMPFEEIVPLIFTSSARNSPVSLAIASIAFPLRPLISLVLVLGPLIELPVLAVYAPILQRIRAKFQMQTPH